MSIGLIIRLVVLGVIGFVILVAITAIMGKGGNPLLLGLDRNKLAEAEEEKTKQQKARIESNNKAMEAYAEESKTSIDAKDYKTSVKESTQKTNGAIL